MKCCKTGLWQRVVSPGPHFSQGRLCAEEPLKYWQLTVTRNELHYSTYENEKPATYCHTERTALQYLRKWDTGNLLSHGTNCITVPTKMRYWQLTVTRNELYYSTYENEILATYCHMERTALQYIWKWDTGNLLSYGTNCITVYMKMRYWQLSHRERTALQYLWNHTHKSKWLLWSHQHSTNVCLVKPSTCNSVTDKYNN